MNHTCSELMTALGRLYFIEPFSAVTSKCMTTTQLVTIIIDFI